MLKPYHVFIFNFIADLNKYSADEIVRMYGTHVLTKITVGGSYRAYYKSVIVEEANRTRENEDCNSWC